MKHFFFSLTFLCLGFIGCPNNSDNSSASQDAGNTDGVVDGTADGASHADAGNGSGTVDGTADGTSLTDAGSSDGAADGMMSVDAGNTDGACELAAAVGGCPECVDGNITCSFAGMSITRVSCGGCQARAGLFQALCDSGSTASAAEIEAGMVCVDAEDGTSSDAGTAIDESIVTTINVISCELAPVGADDVWNPGENASITCQVRNEGPVSHMYYPEAVIETSTTGVTITSGTVNYYGIGFGESWEASVQANFLVLADASLTTPTTVTFTARVQNMNNEGCGTEFHPCILNTPFIFEAQVE